MNRKHISKESKPRRIKSDMEAPARDQKIKDAVATDPDSFIPDASWLARAELVMPRPKEVITVRLDPDVLAWFRQQGPGYQTRINAVLRAFVEANQTI